MIIELLPEWIVRALPVLGLLLVGIIVERHYVSRVTCFTNSLAVTVHVLGLSNPGWILTAYTDLGLFMGALGLYAYLGSYSLPELYYDASFLLYASLPVGAVVLLPTPFLPTLLVAGGLNLLLGLGYTEEGGALIYTDAMPGGAQSFIRSRSSEIVEDAGGVWILLR